MNYNHIIKTETITENTRIEANEGFTSIEFFLFGRGGGADIYINDQIPISSLGSYRVINEPYVKIISDFKITSAVTPFSLIVVKHFYKEAE